MDCRATLAVRFRPVARRLGRIRPLPLASFPLANSTKSSEGEATVPLKDAGFAAFLAWLWPGAGHLYQGRSGKGWLLMICILGTFFYGFFLGEGRVVYAAGSPTNQDFRWPYVCQICAGLPALPALIEARRAFTGKDPLFGATQWYVPPKAGTSELDELLYRLNRYFEFGTVYTMVAGLLNVLAIYDAWKGPVYGKQKREEETGPVNAPPPE